ncbi:energy transducer TonB [Alteromonas sp. KS69]|jgi:TonB family protein|uniref:Protein TonB n=1 Tax=Alteromonas naphthalenivorans TaxID=715451 RepID=F5ZAM0_ALTNA|nr:MULTISPECIES: TonB family protein [Alteromonas]MBB66476.1 energy transducer TonB [Rickettsiales bacterium]PHS57600.1 MAG: energy transducer TonB [Alteromonas sp.]AEF02150.1 TonB-like protein [Alteromonas naphthalenivorans]MBO7924313.1 TonB family protein [Alteromonas sp. K632G]RUP83279.1 energy transducer TonB [Alteromonas sp. KS69]|tara:strand:+ start:2004 stop:3227 length:1224 start_codon:yes stop_codon:yes gene_type:complete
MIEWMISQQTMLTVVLALLILCERFLTPQLGTTFVYKAWLLLPAALVMNNLPIDLVSIPANSISRYLVGINPNVSGGQFNVLFWLWATGASAVAAYIAANHISILRSIDKKHLVRAPSATVPVTSNTSPSLRAYYSDKASTPMLFGFLKPAVLLPSYFKTAFSNSQQSLILEHESVHNQHKDNLWNAIALAFAVLFWFNPVLWIALKSFRSSQELACDNAVLANKSPTEKLIYAKALVCCAEHNSQAVNLYPTFGEKNTMIKRLNAIKTPHKGNKLLAAGTAAIFALVTANMALANVPLQNTEHKQSKVDEAAPVEFVSPEYPKSAEKGNIEGFVVLQFDITKNGNTDNVTVVNATPEGIFDESAKAALEQWKYKPAIKGGVARRQTGLLVQLDYKLDQPLTAGTDK